VQRLPDDADVQLVPRTPVAALDAVVTRGVAQSTVGVARPAGAAALRSKTRMMVELSQMSGVSGTAGTPSGDRFGDPVLPALPTVRVLVVDDDPQAGPLVETALMDAPFRHVIEVAATAAAGLQRIAADEHDVFLIDQQLPDGNGIDLLRTAKARGAHKPFILMTGHGSGTVDEAASREGAADYVEKQMLGAQLERSIRYALRSWQAARLLHERDEQLRQAAKMEAVGRLAGGIAHDFNNLLTAILGYADLIAERLDPGDATARDVSELRAAADRAAALTRQLLTFSRKQFVNPTIVSLNEIISGILQTLPQMVGDKIDTRTLLAGDLAPVRADTALMEQVLLNLVMNSRDAMPEGGRLTIETANIVLATDRPVAAAKLALEPGPYVMMAITDTGSGMDAATRAHAFEPFFTTKPKGKGTGLGLATVYGIVDQSGGAIAVDTAPGQGTAIRIYLPVASAATREAPTVVVRQGGGTETVLLVEDNESVRAFAAKALRRRGYEIHEARSAEEAIDWFATSGLTPRLLITDVVMPGLSGPNLAARLVAQAPNLRVLYISGFTDHSPAMCGPLWSGVPLLQKPFTPGKLAEQVRQALDAAASRPV
jgi:two-component system cell cycle sensor histidine kinase/response regulator CckA